MSPNACQCFVSKQEFSGSPEVKDSASSLLWHRFNPWPGNFHMPRVRQKKKKKGRSKKKLLYEGPISIAGIWNFPTGAGLWEARGKQAAPRD